MPVTDRREPAVYVSIEDASYAAPSLETGRVGYIVTLCDRGPHNRVVTITSREQLYKLFGRPNYRRTSQAHYLADKFLQYSSKLLLVRAMPDDAAWANVEIKASTASPQKITYGSPPTDAKFTFTPSSLTVVASNSSSYNAVSVGDWIYADGDSTTNVAQVVSKTLSGLILTLDRNYDGNIDVEASAYRYTPYQIVSIQDVVSEAQMPASDSHVVWYFYGKGAGTYYNNIKIMGVRNVELEKMYTDTDGVVLYKYLFMDIGIYYLNDDGTTTLLEGPWTVSLTRSTALGSTIRDLTSGASLYIEDVINDNSNFIGCISAQAVDGLVAVSIDEATATKHRLQVSLLLTVAGATVDSATGSIAAGGIRFENGTDGTVNTGRTLPMYNSSGNLESDRDYLNGQILLAYQGALTSVDGSIEQMPECVYPWYQPDYIITGGYPAAVQVGGQYLADYRQDCIHLADTGAYVTSYSADILARQNDVPWNCWTSALYTQYRKIFDPFTGEKIWMNPVYHALERHLYCDGAYFLAEPVAGIEKGAINDPIELAYKSNHTERGDLMDVELNCVIVEPQGKYILTQFTTWKRLSVLKRLHVAKFVAYIRKVIPTLLKDILQRRATQYWIGQAQFRVSNFLSKFLESNIERYSVLKNFTVAVTFDDVRSELNVVIDITPIRAIERINVFIIVH